MLFLFRPLFSQTFPRTAGHAAVSATTKKKYSDVFHMAANITNVASRGVAVHV